MDHFKVWILKVIFHLLLKYLLHYSLGNGIGDDGAVALGKALEMNTTLSSLCLNSKSNVYRTVRKFFFEFLENHIRMEGATALSKALKTNTSLQSLFLSGKYGFLNCSIDMCVRQFN